MNQIMAFNNEADALVNSGQLPLVQGNALIDQANTIIEQILAV